MANPLIQLKNIRKSFGDHCVVKDLSLDVADGEFLTLLGSSGCGKTTILRMIAGFETPDSGQITLQGEDLLQLPANQRAVNTVFQNYALFPHLTVRENISFGMRMQKLPPKQVEERVTEMLQLTRLESLAQRRPEQLSGGQQQRVAIARSLVNHPKVVLLDEPLGALDLQLRRQMQTELKRLQKKLGTTYVYVTHDQEEAMTMSDRIVVMNNGQIEQIGKPEELYGAPRTPFVANFLGESNIFDGKYLENDGQAYFNTEALHIPVARQEKPSEQIAIRPEAFHLVSSQPSEPFLRGTVQETTYMGSVNRVGVSLPSGKVIHILTEDVTFPEGSSIFAAFDSSKISFLQSHN